MRVRTRKTLVGSEASWKNGKSKKLLTDKGLLRVPRKIKIGHETRLFLRICKVLS